VRVQLHHQHLVPVLSGHAKWVGECPPDSSALMHERMHGKRLQLTCSSPTMVKYWRPATSMAEASPSREYVCLSTQHAPQPQAAA
jgi:hypothetical protein